MNNQFSQRVSDIITYSKEEANRLKNRYIGPEHLLLGMLRDGGGKAIEILQKLDIDLNRVKKRLEGFLKEIEDDNLLPDADIPLSPMAAKILKMCILEARLLKSATADTEHVLLAILKDGNNLAATVLEENNIDYKSVFEQLSMKASPNAGMGFTEDDDEEEDEMNMSSRSSQSGSSQSSTQTASKKPSNDTPVLDNFGMDMTRAAEEGRLDPVVGREREIERLAQILSRRKKNNPVLIGEPGVGKSAIVEGLALRIVQKKVSRILFDKRVVMLDMASVVAGTKYRGQFEERIRSIINELQKNPNVILFIDEIHRFNKSQQDALLPHVEDGTLILIGATTENPYFEVNKALVSRSIVFELRQLEDKDIKRLLERALTDEKNGMGIYHARMDADAMDFLANTANGDARAALNALELAVLTTEPQADKTIHITLEEAQECIQKRALNYDKDGDNHYDTISAFIKSMRGSDPDAALYYLAKMIYAGEDPKFIARRVVICASEDVGNADPHALQVAVSAMQAVNFIGMPEGRIPLAQAVTYVACAP